MLFVSLRRIAYQNRYVIHPLYLNTFVTIDKNRYVIHPLYLNTFVTIDKNRYVTHPLFLNTFVTIDKNRYVTHPLYLNTFVTIDKNAASRSWLKQYHNWFLHNIFSKKLSRPTSYKTSLILEHLDKSWENM